MPQIIERNGVTIIHREGAEAQEHMNGLLMELTGTDNMEDAHMAFVGRPALSSKSEPSVAVQFRVPKSWKPQIDQDAARQGMTLSEYLRSLVVAAHREPQAA